MVFFISLIAVIQVLYKAVFYYLSTLKVYTRKSEKINFQIDFLSDTRTKGFLLVYIYRNICSQLTLLFVCTWPLSIMRKSCESTRINL